MPDGKVMLVEAYFSPYYRAGALALGILWCMARPFRRRGNPAMETLACTAFLIVLMFPHCVMLSDGEMSGRAAWLQTEFENMTWVGGDVNTSFEYADLGWKQHVYLIDVPRQVAVLKIPTWNVNEIELSRLPALVDWLGYNNAFCQFARKGWQAAVLGTICLMGSAVFTGVHVETRRLGRSFRVLAFGFAICCFVAWHRPMLASQHLQKAAHSSGSGDYAASLKHLEDATQVLKVLREDTYYVAQRGLLEYRLGHRSNPYSILYQANLHEREGRFTTAVESCRQLLRRKDLESGLRRETCRSLTRSAVYSLNSGRHINAANELREVLKNEPCQLKARFGLLLALLRQNDGDQLRHESENFLRLCDSFQFPNKKMLLSAAEQHLYFSAFRNKDMKTAWESWIRLRFPGWKTDPKKIPYEFELGDDRETGDG